MALIRSIEREQKDRSAPHEPVACSYSDFTDNKGERYLQLDTFGSAQRKF